MGLVAPVDNGQLDIVHRQSSSMDILIIQITLINLIIKINLLILIFIYLLITHSSAVVEVLKEGVERKDYYEGDCEARKRGCPKGLSNKYKKQVPVPDN